MPTAATIRIVIIDDHGLFREGVSMTLAVEPDLIIVGQGVSVSDAARIAAEEHPDILLLDLHIPGGGIAGITAVQATSPSTRVVILTASASQDALAAALRAGAQGYVLKEISSRELAGILRSIAAGRRYVAPELAAHMLSDLLAGEPAAIAEAPGAGQFSEREYQILNLVAIGALNREIAEHLQISEKTVKAYLTAIFHKLGVRNRVEAALAARSRLSAGAPLLSQ